MSLVYKILYLCGIIFWARTLVIASAVEERIFYGASDASAAVFLDTAHFVVADDECNILRIYTIEKSDKPVSQLDLNSFLNAPADAPEADIEAAARVDNRIYWITSHGRNKDGKLRPGRYRFFCTRIDTASTPPPLIPEGTPNSTLVWHLLKHPSPVQSVLAEATRLGEDLSKKQRKKLAPKEEGLNIEGLAYYPPNNSLLIGLRNPLYAPDDKTRSRAIVIELKNPAEVVDQQKSAQFGQVLLWDLDGRAVRGMEYSENLKKHFILAGSIDDETTPVLYQWNGDFNSNPEKVCQWPKSDLPFTPEGIAVIPGTNQLWIFSDDGSMEVSINSPSECMDGELLPNGRCLNKHLINSTQKTFRVRQINL